MLWMLISEHPKNYWKSIIMTLSVDQFLPKVGRYQFNAEVQLNIKFLEIKLISFWVTFDVKCLSHTDTHTDFFQKLSNCLQGNVNLPQSQA